LTPQLRPRILGNVRKPKSQKQPNTADPNSGDPNTADLFFDASSLSKRCVQFVGFVLTELYYRNNGLNWQ
jgi:hypothetical protein